MSKTKSQSAETEERAAEAAEAEQGAPDKNKDAESGKAAPDKNKDAESGKAARGEEVKQPDWQKPDYSGPLTGAQAIWRNQHIRRK